MRKWLTGIATVLLFGFLFKSSAANSIDGFGIDYHGFANRIHKIENDKGIRIGSVTLTRCDNSVPDGMAPYFCDTGVFTVRVRLWLQSNGGPIQGISAYLGSKNSMGEFVLSMTVIILTIDPGLTEAEASAIAEQLATAPRTLSGKMEAAGIRAHFSATLERGFFMFRALPLARF